MDSIYQFMVLKMFHPAEVGDRRTRAGVSPVCAPARTDCAHSTLVEQQGRDGQCPVRFMPLAVEISSCPMNT